MVRLDLGCGSRKMDGFIGIARFVMSRADIVAELSSITNLPTLLQEKFRNDLILSNWH